jgi:hypothetical protein
MYISKSIIVKAIQTDNNELIPIWDSRITFEDSEYYGNILYVEGHRAAFSSLKDCVFDLETKKLSFSEEVDIYPSTTEHSIDDVVYYDRHNEGLEETKVLSIIYKDFGTEIIKGSEIESWTRKALEDKNIEINSELTYTIKRWKPTYILENGKQTKWSHELRKKYNK